MMQKLKKKWGIASNWDFWMIMLVFSMAGMMVTVCRKPIFAALGITAQTPLWVKILVYIPLIFPLYQLGLIVFGFCLGQFAFFWEKEKQVIRAVSRLWKRVATSLSR